MKLEELKEKSVLILGFGREGQDSFLFLRKIFPKKVIGIADKQEEIKKIKGKDINCHLGKNYLAALKDYDVIIKSAGIPYKILPKKFLSKIITQTDIFFENCPGKIIGITGTKGKSTTTSLIYAVLKVGGIKAHLVGNIGKPVLSYLAKATEEDVFVDELSSHQLYKLSKSPDIAVFLNIYPEHLDYYRNFQEYFKAKQNITFCQTRKDFFIYNSSEKLVAETARKTKAKKISFARENADCAIKDGFIVFKGEKIINTKDIPLRGDFNYLNVMPSIIIGKIFGIPIPKIRKAIKNFKPLEHRLERVGTFKGITFYNDALATIPQATIAAIDALGEKVETIMLGGFDRKIEFKELAKKVLNSKIKNTILFPTTGEKIWKDIQSCAKPENRGLPSHFTADNMEEAVKLAYKHTGKGKICLLSCASSSFSIFKDYKEKGDLFKRFVKLLGKNE